MTPEPAVGVHYMTPLTAVGVHYMMPEPVVGVHYITPAVGIHYMTPAVGVHYMTPVITERRHQVSFRMAIGNKELMHAQVSAGGRGARVSACAGLINQLQSCLVKPSNAW